MQSRFGLQIKYGICYFAVILACLIAINILPVVRCRDMLLKAKSSSLMNQASLFASSLSSLNTVQPKEVQKIMELLDDAALSRVLVTDESGKVIYDNAGTQADSYGKYALYAEIVGALSGKNVFHAELRDGAISSRAAMPIVSASGQIGAVFLYEYDTAQASLVEDLRRNLLQISAVASIGAVLISLILGYLISRRTSRILEGIRGIGAGRYDTRIEDHGKDELEQISREINGLADRLQQTESVRQRFVSDASHELKTPLAAITLLSDSIVQNDNMDRDTIRDFVCDIGQEAARLARVTQKLQELTRIGSKTRERTGEVDLKRVVLDAMKMLRAFGQEREVELTSNLADGCLIRANADDIHEVIFNLAENAIKYNHRGGKVQVLLYARDARAELLVDDTGEGVPPEKLEHIFDRFYRVDESRTGEQSGSGLGLSIVRDVVQKHGGTVTAQNRTDGGMRFHVSFPLLEKEKEAAE